VRALLDNLALKTASLGLAMVLWFVIAGEKSSEMGVSVPVELQNVPKDLELTGDSVNAVEVRLRASPGVIQRLGPGEISAQLDLAGVAEGERIVHLTPDAIRVPFGVKVVKISPSIITLSFERTLQKVVPIRPRLVGRPAPGHEVAELLAEPPEVRIAGPKSRVQEVESAFTEPISVEGAETSVAEHVNIGVEDTLLRIQGSPRARVTARIREVHDRRVFDGLGVAVRGGSATLSPATVRVVLTGPASVLAGVSPSDVRPYVELAGADGTRPVPVTVELAPGRTAVTVSQLVPKEVSVVSLKKKSR
jgi:YbbR domain-containing protein